MEKGMVPVEVAVWVPEVWGARGNNYYTGSNYSMGNN